MELANRCASRVWLAVGLKRKHRVERIVAGPDVTTVGVPLICAQCSVPALVVPSVASPHSAPQTNLALAASTAYAPMTCFTAFVSVTPNVARYATTALTSALPLASSGTSRTFVVV